MKIMHVSDLHITSPNFVPEWGENLLGYIESMGPDILLITGDLTNNGHLWEYETVDEYVKRIKCKDVLVVPGNHDAMNEGYTLFEEFFETRYPIYRYEDITILGVDSSQPDIDDGHIGRERYPFICEEIQEAKVKMIALHHHLIPIPGTGRERQIPRDAGDVLKLFCDLGVKFVLSGHKHKSWVWKLEDTYFITCGTSTSRRLKGKSYPSFNVLEIEGEGVSLQEINVIDGSSKEILRTQI